MVNGSALKREELKSFLRNRRARLSPEEFGFSLGTRRRTPGLRRDEVANLANIGITTYTFLEQGRDIRVSARVLDRLAEVLRLSEQEKRHLLYLAIGESPAAAPSFERECSGLELLLEVFGNCPGYLINHRFDVIAKNRAAALIFGLDDDLRTPENNILWRMFNYPGRKQFYQNWDSCAKCLVAYFRSNYVRYTDDDELAFFTRELERSNVDFRQLWSKYEVFDASMLLTDVHINHPTLGQLTGHYALLTPFLYPSFTLCAFIPEPTSNTAAKIDNFVGL